MYSIEIPNLFVDMINVNQFLHYFLLFQKNKIIITTVFKYFEVNKRHLYYLMSHFYIYISKTIKL
jgi:hypothetical protein